MENLILLDIDQILGDKELNIFKKYGTKCEITDFAVVTAANVTNDIFKVSSDEINKRTCSWWSSSSSTFQNVCIIAESGKEFSFTSSERHGAVRPALPYSPDSDFFMEMDVDVNEELQEILLGEYPQTVVSDSFSATLEELYDAGDLEKTGKIYTTDSRKSSDYDKGFEANQHIEYGYAGSKFIRTTYLGMDKVMLSNEREIEQNEELWIRIEPVKWIIDTENNIMLTEKAILSGIQFNNKNKYYGDFENTDIKKFMDKYLIRDLDLENSQADKAGKSSSGKKKNPYGFRFESVSEEDIIKSCVESGVSVFLHGRSGEGKSARIKDLDPDCEIIYLRNATPDSLNGKSVYNSNTGEMIDIAPTWYTNVCKRCEDDPDKIHIVFFDEITNALPSIQGMAFNIVLDREVNGKWKLPDNARIVAAGNDMKDSLAANVLAEPLYDRFAHVNINTTVYSWLKWAATPAGSNERLDYDDTKPERKIHPAIITYVAYKKEEVLRTEFTGESPNADPRKWEMVSKLLYKSENPNMLRALIGEDLTRDFAHFCRQQVITLEDVVNGDYTDEDLQIDTSEKYATVVGLLGADEDNFHIVRDFTSMLGAEFRSIFDSLWIGENKERAEMFQELTEMMAV